MKTDVERGPFGAWAYATRDSLDLSVEQVGADLGYHPASLRKMEAGTPASKRMRRDLPPYYARKATEKGRTIKPAPDVPDAEPGPVGLDALVAALDRQTQAINALVARLGERMPDDEIQDAADRVLAVLQEREVPAASGAQPVSGAPRQGRG